MASVEQMSFFTPDHSINPDDITFEINDAAARAAVQAVKALYVDMGTISSLPTTKVVEGVTTDMVCAEAFLGTPSAQTSDWTVNTDTAGRITISGSISGSTTLKLLMVPQTTVTATNI